ncbi:MAG: menaquinol oxidoreductase [Deltaproteobacteria bacterium]|nr:MAG: menaquinol oxidoreductase [Deltaproteobacteria bacterium]
MSQAGPQSAEQPVSGRDDLRNRIEKRIRRLERASGNGLWSMALFLLVSLAAFNGFSIFPDLSEDTRRLLGAPPPTGMISLALVVYAFSGIIRTLARMSQNIKPYMGLMHAAFFTAFYTFYHLSEALPGNFWAVFFSGISVMGLENYYLWAHSSEAVRKERALLDSMRKGDEGER